MRNKVFQGWGHIWRTLGLARGAWPLIFLCFCLQPARGSTNMTPITVTGFNLDVVIENTASGPPFTGAAAEFNPGEGTAYYQSGLSGHSYGLPVNGTFTNATDGAVFQFQPYTGNNALVLNTADTSVTNGTLTLTSPKAYTHIAVIANSGNGNNLGTATLTLHFSDGSSVVTNFYAPDWFNNNSTATYTVALQGVERINLSNGSTSGAPGNPRFYETTVDVFGLLGGTNKPLTSLDFSMAQVAKSTGIYAISGDTNVITVATLTNLAAANIQSRTATLNGQVITTGNDIPSVTIYYGTSDKTTNAAAWSNSTLLGLQSGSFAQAVSGLSPNTTYYCAAAAVNDAGTAWATPSRSFATLPVTLPTVTNLPATSVQATFSTLQGQVTSTGGDTTTVTVYYGTTDGRTSPAAWSSNVPLGAQSGLYAQTVTGLSPSTTYFFTAKAVNGAGTNWAVPSQTFTTHATNAATSNYVAVLTQHNDNGRTGRNLNETSLNTTNVNTNQFGLLYTRAVDDQIYAEPLVMTNVNILGRGTHNLLIVATVNDTVYAYDADDPTVSAPYWTNSFINPPNIVPPKNTDESAIGACGGNYQDFSGNFGIVGAPVIDPVAGTIYLVARTKEFGTNFVQRLHALDITTGLDRSNSPVAIAATYPGSGLGGNGSVVTFDPLRQNQRPGLLLVNGTIYIAWTSHCDNTPYHGWVMAYDASSLQQLAVFNNTPNGDQAGIWMSNQGLAADTNGNVYVSTGNGDFDGVNNFGESFLKLTRSGTNLTVASWFTPYNWSSLNGADQDLGSGGVLLIPGTSLLLSGGKEGKLYLVNRDNMGGVSSGSSDTNIIQSWSLGSREIHGGPVWWDSTSGSFAYIWADSSDHLRQYQFTNGLAFNTNGFAQGVTVGGAGSCGGLLSLSANGSNGVSGIVWAAINTVNDANQAVVAGTLHAYNAQNVSQELWNSDMVSARDAVGLFAKFVPPVVANGKVYLATFSNRLNVYGELASTAPAQLSVSPTSLNFGAVVIGQTNTQSFQVTNNGGLTLTGSVSTTSPFSISAGSPFILPSGQTGLVQVSFSPTAAVSSSNAVVFTSNGGNNTNAVLGSGVTAAQLAVSPASLNFGTVVIGTSNQLSFTATNLGGAALTGGTVAVSGGPFTILSGSPFNLPGFGTTNIVVSFKPGSAVSFSNNVAVTTGNGGNSTNAVVGSGIATPVANFTGSPTNGIWPLLVLFTNISSGTISNDLWNFGDGTITNIITASVAHTYTGPGTNTVSLTVSGPAGTNTLTLPGYITVTNPPPVSLTIQVSGTNVVLSWSPALGVLQSASQVGGSYATISNAISPYTVAPSNVAQFFRVKVR